MKNNISTAAALMGSAKSEAKTTAARANGAKGGRPAYTRCALYKGEADDEECKNVWWLGTLDNDTLPSVGGFPTAAAAHSEAASRGWRPIRKQSMDS